MKNKNLIAFDLDGVLIDIITPIKRLLIKFHGIELNDDDPKYNQFDLCGPTGLTPKELWKIFRLTYKQIKDTPICLGATELLSKLYEKTNEPPMILTSRPPDAANETYAVVKQVLKKTPFTLVLKHPALHKYHYLNHHYLFYVEDRRRTALYLGKKGITIPLVKRNYNIISNIDKYPNIYYIDGIYELIPHINDFIL